MLFIFICFLSVAGGSIAAGAGGYELQATVAVTCVTRVNSHELGPLSGDRNGGLARVTSNGPSNAGHRVGNNHEGGYHTAGQ